LLLRAAETVMQRKSAVLLVVAFCSLASADGRAQSPVMLHDGGLWSNYTTVPSVLWTSPPSNQEAADDFDVIGTVTRVVANGNGCWQCASPVLAGVYVRFYAWQAGLPGALQYQAFVAAGTPQLLYDPINPSVLDVTLPNPFSATGQHFVSVQASFVGGGYWGMWVADFASATGAPVKFRDNLAGGTWATYVPPFLTAINADLDLELWGFPATSVPQPVDPCGPWSILDPPQVATSTHTLVRDLKVIAPDDVWAVGDALPGVIGALDNINVAWHWDGTGWIQVPVPNPTPAPGSTNCALYAVDGSGPNDVYAAGYQSITVPGGWYGTQIEVAHWDGSQWSVLPNTPLPPTSIGAGVTGARVFDVDVAGPNDVWFAGFWIDLLPSGFTTEPGLLMHYDGSNFTMTTVPLVVSGSTQGQTFTKIEAISAQDVWAIGYRHGLSAPLVNVGAPLVFHWNGSQWSSLSPPIPGTPSIFSDVAALGPNAVWLLGWYTPTPGGPATSFMVFWNGSTWTTLPGPPGGGSLKAFAPNDIYTAGGGVWHFDGNGWTQVQAFASLSGATFAAIDGLAPCQLWGAGGQSIIGQLQPFAARQQSSIYASTQQHQGCAPGSTPGTLVAVTPPKLGSWFSVQSGDPGQLLQPPSGLGLSYWAISGAPATTSGCGLTVPGAGGGGNAGELLIDVNGIVLILGPVALPAGSFNATHGISIPSLPQIAGIEAWTQAALVDAQFPQHMILTSALQVRLGY
jgi:hypothetical protein